MTAKIYIIALLFIGTLYAQDSLVYKHRSDFFKVANLDSTMRISLKPSQTLKIFNRENKSITIDFSGDTLKTYGDLHLDSASAVFFEYCMKRWINWRNK